MPDDDKAMPDGDHVCPTRHAGWLASSLRKLIHNPKTILRDLVHPGEIAVDLGCGPGFFTLPMARMVGEKGRVVAVDLQEEMLKRMRQRAASAGLLPRIQTHACAAGSIGYAGPAAFALAFYMAHEVPNVANFLGEIYRMLIPGGRLLLAEPKFHVTAANFQKTVALAVAAGFKVAGNPSIILSRAVLLHRTDAAGKP
ncbi:MAG: class I SAM-dependent methyltransferase [Solidesulfovibrio sp.]